MIKLETINYEQNLHNLEFISKCMAGRESEVTLHIAKDSRVLFSVKTRKNNRDDYISLTVRNSDNFIGLKNHIESVYGGYILPVLPKMNLKQSLEGAEKQYKNYLDGLFRHRVVRQDSVLFAFCFVQEKQEMGESKYERFLHKALDFSRKHLSKLLTRENQEQYTQKDESLLVYRSEATVKKNQFEKIYFKVSNCYQECKSLYNACQLMDQKQLLQSSAYALSIQLISKCQKITTTFAEIEEAYHRRILLLQKIKELKAENVRHKYNSHNQSNEKMLEVEKGKHAAWSESLVQEMECTLIILDSLIKEIISKYMSLQKMLYENEE